MASGREINVEVRDASISDQPVSYSFSEGFTLGRHESCQVQLDNKLVSRRHAEVVQTPDGWALVDLNSTNGIYQHGKRVSRVELEISTAIEFGRGGPMVTFSVPKPIEEAATRAGMPAFTEDVDLNATAFAPAYEDPEGAVKEPVTSTGYSKEEADLPDWSSFGEEESAPELAQEVPKSAQQESPSLAENEEIEPKSETPSDALGLDSGFFSSLEDIVDSDDNSPADSDSVSSTPVTESPSTSGGGIEGLSSGFFRSLDEVASEAPQSEDIPDNDSVVEDPFASIPDPFSVPKQDDESSNLTFGEVPPESIPESGAGSLDTAQTGDWSIPDSDLSDWDTVGSDEEKKSEPETSSWDAASTGDWNVLSPANEWDIPESPKQIESEDDAFESKDKQQDSTPASGIESRKPEPEEKPADSHTPARDKYEAGLSTGLFEALGDIRKETEKPGSGSSGPAKAGSADDLLSSGFFRTLEAATKGTEQDSFTPPPPSEKPKKKEEEDWRYSSNEPEPEPWANWDTGDSSDDWAKDISKLQEESEQKEVKPESATDSSRRADLSASANWGVMDTPEGWGTESKITPVFDDTPDDGGYDWSRYKEDKEESNPPSTAPKGGPGSVTGFVKKFEAGDHQEMGSRTQMMMAAFNRMGKKSKKRYYTIIGIVGVICIAAGVLAFINWRQSVAKQNEMERLEGQLSEMVISLRELQLTLANSGSEISEDALAQVAQQQERIETAMKDREEYKSLDHTEQLIYDMARLFGENEIKMPRAFVDSVKKYIGGYRYSRKFQDAVERAKNNGYLDTIVESMLSEGVPPQFFYLGVQESAMNPMSVGPPLSSNYIGPAKGMWQFIAETGKTYGLNPGPLANTQNPDPLDDRHNWEKATRASAKYLGDIYKTKARASGLLVMASYNWGEHRVIERVKRIESTDKDISQYLPGQTVREANFWELMKLGIPEETRKYVFNIMAMSVIGEDPSIIGLNMENPLKAAIERYTGGSLADEGEVEIKRTFW